MVTESRNPLTHPLDTDIVREVSGRKIWFWGSMISIVLSCTALGGLLGAVLFEGVMVYISTVFGFVAGIASAFAAAETFFFIRNDTTGMFVTQDMWETYQRREDVNVAYGPGFHISYPWERRIASNNISLEEATNTFEFEVLCLDGTLFAYGSYRLRPDFRRPVTFLNGVAAVADEIVDLIKSKITTAIQPKKVVEAILMLQELNDELKREFGTENDHPVEEIFGIQFTDVTISRMLPSEELQRTITAVAEAASVRRAILTVLGVQTEEEFDRKREQGLISSDDVERARYAAMSMSGNLEGMTVDRNEHVFDLKGVDPEAQRMLAKLAPALATIFGGKSKPGGNKPRPKSTRSK